MLLLDMQSLWLYIDDLMGKGLEWTIILELMFYFSANWVPMALPLSILLASIMTLGKMGESNELTAMKAAGMSLFRIMRPMLVIMVLVSGLAFYFSNSLWPKANFKLRVLISDIQETKASIVFKEGIFYEELEGYNIRIGKKLNGGTSFENILIYDYTNIKKNPGHLQDPRDYKRIISAKSGTINQSQGGKYLLLSLDDGFVFQEMNPAEVKDSKLPYSRYYFDKANLKFKLKSFEFERSEENQYEKEEYLLSLDQINDKLDTNLTELSKLELGWFNLAKNNFSIIKGSSDSLIIHTDTIIPSVTYYQGLSDVDKKLNLNDAIAKIESKKQSLNVAILKKDNISTYRNDLIIKRHEKFTLSYACLMLFFMGASLGAIVKKGGFGVPVIIAILLFLVYFMLTRGGQEMASSGTLSPVVGMWLSAMILTPISIFIFYKANNDSKIFDFDFYIKLFKRKK
jgi:lipopolysaccharide export system permease protein